jgi:hypothetical protein
MRAKATLGWGPRRARAAALVLAALFAIASDADAQTRGRWTLTVSGRRASPQSVYRPTRVDIEAAAYPAPMPPWATWTCEALELVRHAEDRAETRILRCRRGDGHVQVIGGCLVPGVASEAQVLELSEPAGWIRVAMQCEWR